MNRLQAQIQHLALIMDGNNRWGQFHKISEYFDLYNIGVNVLENLIPLIAELGIKYTSFFALSSENIKSRPQSMIRSIMKLLNHHLRKDLTFLKKYNFKISFIGDLTVLNSTTLENIAKIQSINPSADKNLIIAFNYGGKNEILDACNKLLQAGKHYVTQSEFQQFLYLPDLPQIDLLIRTGGEHRLSNFLPWHTAYSELYFTKKLWPDFNNSDLLEAVEQFNNRVRNFGKER